MKKLSIFLLFILIFTMVGCSKAAPSKSSQIDSAVDNGKQNSGVPKDISPTASQKEILDTVEEVNIKKSIQNFEANGYTVTPLAKEKMEEENAKNNVGMVGGFTAVNTKSPKEKTTSGITVWQFKDAAAASAYAQKLGGLDKLNTQPNTIAQVKGRYMIIALGGSLLLLK